MDEWINFSPENPKVSILIPARNEAENLKRTLPSVLRQGAFEVLVLDDLSEDETAQGYPGFRLLQCILGGGSVGWAYLEGDHYPALEALRFANGQVLAFRRDTVLEDIAIASRVKNYGLYLGLNVQELFGDDSGSWKELFGYPHEKPGHPVPLHHTMAIRSLGSRTASFPPFLRLLYIRALLPGKTWKGRPV